MNWDCPYCNRAQTVTAVNRASAKLGFTMQDPDIGPIGLIGIAIRCANPQCEKATVTTKLVEGLRYKNDSSVYIADEPNVILSHRLMPDNRAKPQPEYIPATIREDYEEACKILELSPKASATLARRCLQGMIRNFADIQERTLFHEIEKLKSLADEGKEPKGVSPDSIDALHHLRSLGNIGAHMEKDIDLIIGVEPDEAALLIELIETLFDEWYIERNKREGRFSKLKAVAEEKEDLRKLPRPTENE